ncbi:hypothetical protein B7P43_G10037 [Cryptotermes secundus]|uniref:Uncharacterized protein n=2 Tax=Cryptotermes secundus TaxID=105785 RepID=A0A2J7Q5S5_9NEOP|nr:hypothetical protein B7P43_G10037 [Cryptotermes secundus]
MFAPWLLPQLWSLPALVLWAGLAEECLLPILLSLCDRNFTAWVANIYTYRDRRLTDLARQHQGLDGKFRVFNAHSQNQTESQSSNQLQSQQQQQTLQQEPVKFPITNGSLFTSVDGRLPIIHNYRRGMRTNGAVPSQIISMGLPVAQTRRHELLQRLISLNKAAIENQHSDLFKERTSDETCKLPQIFSEKSCDFQVYLQTGRDTIEKKATNPITHNSRQQNETGSVLTDFGIGNLNSEEPSSDCEDYLNSEGLNEYNVDDDDDEPIYATLSSRSCCSATTAANDDFEFFQHEEKFSTHVSNDTEKSTMLQMPEKLFLCGSQSEEENSGQSLLSRYQREMVGTGDSVHQECQCTDWTVNQNNEVLKLVLPLIGSSQNQNDNMELSYHSNETSKGKNITHSKTIIQNASEILRAVIQNELKNSTSNAFKKGTNDNTGSNIGGTESKSKDNSCRHQYGSNTNSKNIQSSCEPYLEAEDQKEIISPPRKCENLKLQVANMTRKKRVKQNMLAGSLSLNNLDELLLEEDEGDLVVQKRNIRKSSNSKMRNRPQNDPNSSDEREVIFELPVKSESVLSLYRLDLDAESRSSECTVTDLSYKDVNSRRFHKQIPGNRHIVGQTPARRLAQQTPPMRRIHRQKQLPVPVLSVESLTTALTCAGVSYLDNGDLCRHGSVPDLQRVFVSDYI